MSRRAVFGIRSIAVRVTGEPPFISMTKVSPGVSPLKAKPNSCSGVPPLELPELLEATFPPLLAE
jgi:hypothetical protein